MLIYGVPPVLVNLLIALHTNVTVGFDVDGVRRVLDSIIGVKQGDLLGPDLFIFLICAIMESWRAEHTYPLCIMRSKPDCKLTGRRPTAGGLADEFAVGDSLYADDSALPFCSRADVVEQTPNVMRHFERWGMEIHSKAPGAKKESKSEVLFCAKPARCYMCAATFDGADLSDIQLPDGRSMPVVDRFCYLGSWLARNCGDARDVDARIESAGKAFGALRSCVFASTSVSLAAKRAVYERVVLAIGLYGSECWSLTTALLQRLRVFHAQCLRAMCRVTRKHTWDHHISTQELGQRMGIESIDMYLARRQLRWLGHVSRMPYERLPRRMLSSWVPATRPKGCPEMTYGRTMYRAMELFGIDRATWPALAADRDAWRTLLMGGPLPPPPPPQTPPHQQQSTLSPHAPPFTPRPRRMPVDTLLVLTPSPIPMGDLRSPRACGRPRRDTAAVPPRRLQC